MSVTLVTLALLIVVALQLRRDRPDYVFFDSEREWTGENRPVHGDLHFQGWILGLLAAIALFFWIGAAPTVPGISDRFSRPHRP